jgi:hypothetical protein
LYWKQEEEEVQLAAVLSLEEPPIVFTEEPHESCFDEQDGKQEGKTSTNDRTAGRTRWHRPRTPTFLLPILLF